MARISVPFLGLELDVAGNEIAELLGHDRRGLQRADRIEQVERQLLAGLYGVAVGIHVDVEARARVAIIGDAVEAGGEQPGLQQIGIGGTIGEADLEAAGFGNADQMGPVVAGIGHRVRRPGRARCRPRRIDALVGVDGRVEQRGQRIGRMHDTAEELIAQFGHAELAGLVLEQIAAVLPHRDMGMAAIAGEIDERLRHEGGAQPVLLGDRAHHIFEEGVAIGGRQRGVELPVHLELAVSVLVIVLIRLPAQRQHGVANLGDHLVAPHQGLLVVARLRLLVRDIGRRTAVGGDQEELAFDTGFQLIALRRRIGDHALEQVSRRMCHRLAVHPGIGREPADLRLPRQLDQARRIGHREHVGIGRGHVEPGREACEASAGLHHAVDRRRRHQLGALHAEQVGIRDQEIFDAALTGDGMEATRHDSLFESLKTPASSIRRSRRRRAQRCQPICRVPESSWCRRAARRPSPPPRSSRRRDPPAQDYADDSCRRPARSSAPPTSAPRDS